MDTDRLHDKLEVINRNISDLKASVVELNTTLKQVGDNHEKLELRMGEDNDKLEGRMHSIEKDVTVRLVSLEQNQNTQREINESNKDLSKHRWVKITAVVLIFEVVGVGIGMLLGHVF